MDLSKREKVLLQLLLTQKEFRPAAFSRTALCFFKTVYTDFGESGRKNQALRVDHCSFCLEEGSSLKGIPLQGKKATNSSLLKVKPLTNILLNIVNCLSFANYFFSKKANALPRICRIFLR